MSFQKEIHALMCEGVIEHGLTVYAAGEEVVSEGLAGALDGDLMRR